MPPKISICIACCNEEAKIEYALKSAKACSWCNELLVYDSGSTDRTVEIARKYADRIEFHKWIDYSTSKKNMTHGAINDWVFILDADEEISPCLAQEIADLPGKTFCGHSVMIMPRRNFLLGKYVRSWDPDYQNRLIDRKRVYWPKRSIHDERKPTEGSKLLLKKHLIHNRAVDDFSDYFDGLRYEHRINLMAQELFERGKRTSFLNLFFRPFLTFLKYYILKKGILDGSFGLLIAQKAMVSVQLKYAKLWHLQQHENNKGHSHDTSKSNGCDSNI
jgi:(heptosyl)LPS beta-1,4-glucosyltransferase